MKVTWAGTFVPEFSRNQRLATYLASSGLVVDQVRVDIWPDDRVDAFRKGRLRVFLRMLVAYPVLLIRLLVHARPDVYLVSYPGWFDIPVVKLVALLKRRPVVFDVFFSLYDTAVTDRGLMGSRTVVARTARLADRLALRWADRVIADCPAHAEFLAEMAGLEPGKVGILYVGAADETFTPRPRRSTPGVRLVLFYGTYVPLQGVEWIVRAAGILNHRSDVKFRLIGSGQDRPRVEALTPVGSWIEFLDPVPLAELPVHLASADLVLGIFGTSDKADRVVPHKVYESLASGRPVLTGATRAVLGVFSDEEVATCAVGDPDALASAIEELLDDDGRLASLSYMGRRTYEEHFSCEPQGVRFRSELERVIRG